MLRNLKLVIEYNGSRYHGWQRQENGVSVQAVIETAFRKICGTEVKVVGAGRTDAGVHASGQAAHAHVAVDIPDENLLRALNSLLPEDVVVHEVKTVPETFHARYSARSKFYRYTIFNRPLPSALEHPFVWHVPQKLDEEAVGLVFRSAVGKHDFSAFRGTGSGNGNATREVYRAETIRKGDHLLFEIEGDGFLRHMVRVLVGTAVEVGLGRMTPEDFRSLLEHGDRTKAGPTAPPQGLNLIRVDYE